MGLRSGGGHVLRDGLTLRDMYSGGGTHSGVGLRSGGGHVLRDGLTLREIYMYSGGGHALRGGLILRKRACTQARK